MEITQQSNQESQSMWNFYKGRNTAVNVLSSLTKRHVAHAEHWLPQIKLLQHLNYFPRSSIEIRGIDSGAKSKLLKAHLNEEYPECEVKVKLHRFVSMSNIKVTVISGKPDGIRDVCDLYQDKGQQNPSTGSFDWDNKVEIVFSNQTDDKPTHITGDNW